MVTDDFTVDTWNLKRLYVLFFMELATRRILCFGVTEHPNQEWVSQQARNLTWELQEQGSRAEFLICDNDKKFPFAFEHVLASEGVRVIQTPLQAPKANAYAERWVGSARRECLDWLLIRGRPHLELVIDEYVDHYNNARPHRGLWLHPPNGSSAESARARSDVARGWADYFVSTHARRAWLRHEYLHPTPTSNRPQPRPTLRFQMRPGTFTGLPLATASMTGRTVATGSPQHAGDDEGRDQQRADHQRNTGDQQQGYRQAAAWPQTYLLCAPTRDPAGRRLDMN